VDWIATGPTENRRPVYGENWGGEDTKEAQAGHKDIQIAGALVFWTIMIFIGVILNIVAPLMKSFGASDVGMVLALSHYILYIPGSLIIALIVAAYIGEKVGGAVDRAKDAFRLGLLNAVYTAFIYAIIIAILYLIIKYADPGILPNLVLNNFLAYMVGIPVAIVIIVVPLLAGLAAARHGAK
jgi:hypothetical protein